MPTESAIDRAVRVVNDVVISIGRQFYADRTREFMRDRQGLMIAVSLYAHECNQRGWEFDHQFIFSELMNLLQEIKRSGADIKYLPTYLKGAVTRRIGMKAEELSDKAKTIQRHISKKVGDVKTVVIVEKSDVEVMALLHKTLKQEQKASRTRRREQKATQQAKAAPKATVQPKPAALQTSLF